MQEDLRRRIAPIVSRPQYMAHMAPVLELLPDDLPEVTIVASHGDLAKARRKGRGRFVRMEHGAGQSYGGDPRSMTNPNYAGGSGHEDVGLFLAPNEHAARRWQRTYPRAAVRVVGCPRLGSLPKMLPHPAPVVAVSFHWDGKTCPELRSAFGEYADAVLELARRMPVIGHGHPLRRDLVRFYRRHGIEHVPDFDEVCRRADIYVCDNSSTLFEFAATGRPVVLLNSSRYRPHVDHGLRFWGASSVGLNVDRPADLVDVVADAIFDPRPAEREAALRLVYALREGAAQAAAAAITEWAA